jgi:hypothetical protein
MNFSGFAGNPMKSRAALNGVWGLRPQRVQGRALAFLPYYFNEQCPVSPTGFV